MIDWIVILQLLNTVFLFLIGLFLRSYLPSYFEKKGENRAVKEDTGEITRIDESVRSEIAEIATGRGVYLREQKECLLKYYDLLIEFYYEKLVINFGDFPIDHGETLATFQKSFNENVLSIIKSYQRVVLYFDFEEPVRIHGEQLLKQVLKARIVMKKNFGPLKLRAIDENQMWMSRNYDKEDKIVEETNKASREYWDVMNPIIEEMSKALRLYLTSLNQFLRPGEIPKIPKGMFSQVK